MTIPQAFLVAEQYHQAGQFAAAERIYRQILAAQPNHPDALHLLGILVFQAGRDEEAVALIRQSIAANPAAFQYQIHLGNALSVLGHRDDAITAYRQALKINPDCVDAHYNLGIAQQLQDQLDEAISAYRTAIRLQPDFHIAYNSLGAALKAKGRLDEAVVLYRRALEINPGYAEAHNSLGVALYEMRQFDEAISAYRRALQLNPDYAEAWYNLGNVLQNRGKLEKAAEAYDRAIKIRPDYVEALNGLGGTLDDRGHFEEAILAFRRALQIRPEYADAINNLANTLGSQGQLDEAIACYRQAMQLQPASFRIHSNFLAILHYRPEITPPELLEAHTEYDRIQAAPLRAAWQAHQNTRDPDRPLRLGFISPHFASHPVGRFLIRPLESLDFDQFFVICYSDTPAADQMTSRIRASTTLWRDISGWTDEQVASQVRADGVDILFDLAGHTAGNRLQVFARKPAPIQITWMDYVGTTGLSAMDYILADDREILAAAEPWYKEKVLRLPDDYICYDPPSDAPPVGPLPCLANGRFTFASFNIPPKITPPIAGVWARILERVPQSRLMLKNRGLDDPDTASRYRQMFAAHGIGPDQLELRGWSPPPEVLACYNEVDLALDTFPYNGGLTTCEAIWMGVPVITCPGETFASRHGLTHLSAAGLTETIAANLDHYVELAVELAGDPNRLAAMRAGMRQRAAASSLCDGKRFATHLTAILREVWRRWVHDRPASG